LDFDEMIMKQSPESFVDDILINAFNIDTAICGFNFTYGHKAGGTAETLKADGLVKNFSVHVMNPVTVNDQVVSSTLIRGSIEAGHVDEAAEFLGRPYTVKGEVLHGNQLGRTMGFPTCNILMDEGMVAPANGVYVTRCMVDGVWYPGVTNVGHKPTIGHYEKNVETNILDFDQMIYGKTVCVEFFEKIRDEKKFSSLDELKDEIGRNKEYARNFHEKMKIISVDTDI
ncbi:MAG: riboflavin biosynthesis protein RibF, partial [Firmicutes bacterium]|nr:riboflavin biosynthesis protein RibF [Bacillota bacterium]